MPKCPTPTKHAHGTEAVARKHMRGLRSIGGSPDLKVYLCECGAWHVGHSRDNLKMRIRRVTRKGKRDGDTRR